MSKFGRLFTDSLNELNHVKTLTIAAMFTALSIALSMFQIPVSNFLQIRFGFIAIAMVGMLYGPVVAALVAGASDLLSLLLFPTGPFFFGLTVSAVLGGIIYGVLLYKQQLHPVRILITMAIIGIVVNILLGTYWMSLMYGKGYFVLLPARVVKNIITIPMNAAIFYAVTKSLTLVFKKIKKV